MGLTIFLTVVDIIVCIVFIGAVIMQEGSSDGLGSIAGGSDTYFGSNKGRDRNVMLKRFTSGMGIVFVALTVVLIAITK